MSKEAPPSFHLNLPEHPAFAIVASRYNSKYVDGLVDSAKKEIRKTAPEAQLEILGVPGAYEIPVAAAAAARSGRFLAVLALGVIFQGKTQHANLISYGIVEGLMQISLQTGVPIINEVLLLDTVEQAKKRCLEEEINRGAEAARAALHIASTLRNFHREQ